MTRTTELTHIINSLIRDIKFHSDMLSFSKNVSKNEYTIYNYDTFNKLTVDLDRCLTELKGIKQ